MTKSRDPIVYYVQAGDQIKIGTTGQLRTRMTALQAEHPVLLKLLAVEPGGREIEAERHQMFAADRVKGEWFRATASILEHAEGLRERFDMPAITFRVPQPQPVRWIAADGEVAILPRAWFSVPWRRALIAQLLGWDNDGEGSGKQAKDVA